VELRHYTPFSIDPAFFCNRSANYHRDLQRIDLLASRQTVYLTRCCMACGLLEGHAFGFTTFIPFKPGLPTVRGSVRCSLNIGSNIPSSGQYFGNRQRRYIDLRLNAQASVCAVLQLWQGPYRGDHPRVASRLRVMSLYLPNRLPLPYWRRNCKLSPRNYPLARVFVSCPTSATHPTEGIAGKTL
jgi:hypothetical protein